ncbi:hypothetical protein [Streptomyces sp. NPDC090026]|uniref:hypothetical protein n=1 Tax=Streptomyces sp. NPDC090026 TaxID=3365923 RepID=UPI0037F64BF0
MTRSGRSTRAPRQRLGLHPADLPEQPDGLHNALADARHNLRRFWALQAVAERTGRH